MSGRTSSERQRGGFGSIVTVVGLPPTDWLPCCDGARLALQLQELRALPFGVVGAGRPSGRRGRA